MNNTILKRVLEKSIERELAEYDNAPEHKFSLKHRIAMKRIFARYDKNTRKNPYKTIELSMQTMPRYRLKQKMIVALVIVLLMTLITGWFFPLHRVTEPQISWLRSRYDFPNMVIRTAQDFTLGTNSEFTAIGSWKISEDYLSFLSDLVELGIYTDEDIFNLRHKTEPIDLRLNEFDPKHQITTRITLDLYAETPMSSAQEFVSYLESQIEYYTERSKDKTRALEGDEEFAALIRDNYLPLQKNYLELLKKLYAEPSDNNSETSDNVLLNLDKDDRRYLLEINKL